MEAGDSVAAVHVGDPVVATLTAFCGECSRCTSGREYRCLKGRGVGHTLDGGLAQFVKLPESSVVPVPEGIDLYEASIAACPMGVALQAVRDVARARPGETVAVTGAGGGLGAHAFQLAAALGARALAVTASPAKEEPLRQLGVGEVIVAGELDFSEIVFALTEDQGVDVVIDTVGSTLLRSSLASLAQYGRLVLLGEIAGGTAPIRPAEIIFRDSGHPRLHRGRTPAHPGRAGHGGLGVDQAPDLPVVLSRRRAAGVRADAIEEDVRQGCRAPE